VPRAVRELPRLAPAGSLDSLYFPQESSSGRLHQVVLRINQQGLDKRFLLLKRKNTTFLALYNLVASHLAAGGQRLPHGKRSCPDAAGLSHLCGGYQSFVYGLKQPNFFGCFFVFFAVHPFFNMKYSLCFISMVTCL
ncbi:hypothetical protein, partial [Domibacillus robiginosus]|uniref:hypothetical protein n=1 Tax=Domibacillus robiginosus TaxID=1071054 RepID=UPI001C11A60B